MKLLHLSLAWLCGISAAAWFGADGWLLAAAVGLAASTLAVARREPRIIVAAVLLAAICAFGVFRERTSHHPLPDDAVARWNDGVAVRLRGTVRADPDLADTSQQFAVDARELELRGAWHDASGAVLVRAPLLPQYRTGDLVELEGALETPPAIPNGDYAGYLAQRGILSVMSYPEVRITGHESPAWWQNARLDLRRSLSDGLARALPEPQAALAQGVLLGERASLPPELRDALNTSNTSHLVVVSGSNVVLLSGFVTLLLAPLLGRRWALGLSIVAIGAYAVLVGLSPPVSRAMVMGVILVVARTSGRQSHGLTALLFAAAAMAGWRPSIVQDVSFQLSFAATAGILYAAPVLRRFTIDTIGWLLARDTLPRWVGTVVAEPFAVTVAASAATSPLLMLHFGRLSTLGLAANMLVVPAFPLILGTSLVAAVGGLLPFGHVALGAPAYWLLRGWISIAESVAAAPGAAVAAGRGSAALMLTSYALLAVIATRLRGSRAGSLTLLLPARNGLLRRTARRTVFAAPALALVTSLGFVAWPQAPPRLQVTVLDVGQGDAILIETPGGRDVLIDGGPGGAVLRGLGAELPWHDRSLDLIIVTHVQADHATGVLDVLDRYHAARIITNVRHETSLLDGALISAAEGEDLTVERLAESRTIDLGDGVRLELLAAPPGLDGNDASIVVRVTYGGVSFLLTGDIEAAREHALVESGVPLTATVLKVAHHGSATSSSAAFLNAVRPSIAVISAGRDNAFGHPAPAVTQRLSGSANVYTTAEHGRVRFTTDGKRLSIDAER